MEYYHVGHCIHDLRVLDVPMRVTAPFVYVRFHGDPSHRGNYSRGAREAWAGRINRWADASLDVFVYFNNDPQSHAVKNAQTLKSLPD